MSTRLDAVPTPASTPRRAWFALAVLMLPVLLIADRQHRARLRAARASPRTSGRRRTTQLWIVDVYSLVLAALLVTMGSLGDRVGRRRLLMIGATGFAVVSAAAAFAPSAEIPGRGPRAARRVRRDADAVDAVADPQHLHRRIGAPARDRRLGVLLHRRVGARPDRRRRHCSSTSTGARCSWSPCPSCCRCWSWRPAWCRSRGTRTRARWTRSACCCH